MRMIVIASLGLTSLPWIAVAQTRTTEDYVCALTDECAGEAEATPGERSKARSSDTRAFSFKRPNASTNAAPEAAAAAPSRPKPATKMAAKTRPAAGAAAQRRVDLRLTFKLGSAELTEQAMVEAKVFAEAVRLPALAARKFMIEGHTDAQGGRDYNLDLSQRRARAVADYLASLGVPRGRFDVRGYGFDRPLPGRSAANAENRRVEAVLIS